MSFILAKKSNKIVIKCLLVIINVLHLYHRYDILLICMNKKKIVTIRIFKSFIMKEKLLKPSHYDIQEVRNSISEFFKSVFDQSNRYVVKLDNHFVMNVDEFDSS